MPRPAPPSPPCVLFGGPSVPVCCPFGASVVHVVADSRCPQCASGGVPLWCVLFVNTLSSLVSFRGSVDVCFRSDLRLVEFRL